MLQVQKILGILFLLNLPREAKFIKVCLLLRASYSSVAILSSRSNRCGVFSSAVSSSWVAPQCDKNFILLGNRQLLRAVTYAV